MYLDLAGKQLCFSPGKGISRRNESTEGSYIFSLQNTDDNTPVLLIPFIVSFITAKTELISRSENNQVLLTDHYFSRKEMTTRNKRKLAALNKENCEERPRSNLAQNSNAPTSQEDYITRVSEEIVGWVTKMLSKEFSRTENGILGALARLDDFLMNPLLQGHSGTTPEPSRNALSNSLGTNEDDSQNDPHPEAGLFHGQIVQNSGPEDGHDR